MLGARSRGYLAPEDALRAAFRDIQAHELALIAGMRATLDDAMSRIDPAVIARSADAPGSMSAIVGRFTGSHEARLWRRYVQAWDAVSRDADDDFQQRFGEPFGRAYQAQLDALQSKD
jgi:type VI secretion system protein